ncbi:hypothetical protein [Sorangium sp. So ce887]|uniref:hypothetical protein n=1 Tax=Sorangium sp. So ce887 TaxID=3133324 RepID=UPI003F61BD3A
MKTQHRRALDHLEAAARRRMAQQRSRGWAWRSVEAGRFQPSPQVAAGKALDRWLFAVAWHHMGDPWVDPGKSWPFLGGSWRTTNFGTDSPNGSRFVERILTVVTTLRMQGRNVLDYVTAACEASLQDAAALSAARLTTRTSRVLPRRSQAGP